VPTWSCIPAPKYLNGHSDVMAGALVFARKDAHFERASRLRSMLGGILGPFEAALLLRGMRTLHVRVRHQCVGAMTIAKHCRAATPESRRCSIRASPRTPGMRPPPGRMHGGFGGMLSVRVKGGEAAAIAAAANVKIWKRATSLGGVESLLEHRASVEGPGSPCPPDLLRLSVGLESPDDLIGDLEQAMATL
jgi:cystathionine gamma-synthase